MINRKIMIIVGIIVGGVAGYLYWKHIGCSAGSCPITSGRYNSTLYGMFLGGIVFDLIRDCLR
tara:strand:+ start:649 stop:837 length:189 start_codon:yes stop_codon:yes gene_type:complete